LQGWLKIKSAATYADISERTLRCWLIEGLRHVRKSGTVYIKPDWVDEFLLQFEAVDTIDAVVDEVLESFK